MSTLITLVNHHIGRFERDCRGRLKYKREQVTEIEKINVDILNAFFVEGLLMDIGYTRYKERYWLELCKELGRGLRVLRRDMDVVKMYEPAMKNGSASIF